MAEKWKLIDHTADVRLEANGADLADLFVNAAAGLTAVVMPDVSISPDEELSVSVEGEDDEELLVAWLREILFRLNVDGFMLAHVKNITLTDDRCEALILGRRRKPDEEPEMEIKAVTYHGLSIDETPDGLVARVVFDI